MSSEQVVAYDYTVSDLVSLLHGSTSISDASIADALGLDSNTTVATEAAWQQFWALVAKADAPATASQEDDGTEEVGEIGDIGGFTFATVAGVLAAITAAITLGQKIWEIIARSGLDDQRGRSEWTKRVVYNAYVNDPSFNYVVVYPRHAVQFNGQRDRDWAVRDYRYRLAGGIAHITYKLYAFKSGTFFLLGDGGYANWAYYGRVVRADPDSKRPRGVVFYGS